MGDRRLKSELFDQIARVGKALGNGKRLELLDLLAQAPRSVENLAETAGLGLSTASAHLQVLRGAGLVTSRREGARVFYDLAGGDVLALYHHLRTVAGDRVADVGRAREEYLGFVGERAVDDPASAELSREELLDRSARGELTVLDVRPHEEYTAAHVPGAVSLPLDQLTARIGELPAGTEIVVYCRGADCVLAYEAVEILRAGGRGALRLRDGMVEWRLSGAPTESGHAA